MRAAFFLAFLGFLGARSAAQLEGLGKIDFPNSGAPAAQDAFRRGVLLLHSFAYDDAAEAFREAQAADPGFALAVWGEALTNCHPIWQEENRDMGQAALARLAPTSAERAAKAPTERERGLLAAVETLFGEGTREERARAYAADMAELAARFPDDHEIAAFHALALLGSSTEGRDVPTYMRAAAIAEEILVENPDHPGALHYAIHSYDDPVHAPLGLRMARRYGAVASAADHALHMPSHIYVALGMWDESAAANEASSAAADARRERLSLSLEARGYHSLAWLQYSYLQLGRAREAWKLLEDMQRDEAGSRSKRTRSGLVQMRAAYVLETGDWTNEIARRPVDVRELELDIGAAELWFRGYSALKRGERELAEAGLAALREHVAREGKSVPARGECCNPARGSYIPGREAAHVMELELEACLVLESDPEAALALFARAAEAEDAMGFDFGPPVVKPAHELYGEVLLELERPAEALAQFEAALERAPRRSASLAGLVRAARLAGDEEGARASEAELARMRHAADPPSEESRAVPGSGSR